MSSLVASDIKRVLLLFGQVLIDAEASRHHLVVGLSFLQFACVKLHKVVLHEVQLVHLLCGLRTNRLAHLLVLVVFLEFLTVHQVDIFCPKIFDEVLVVLVSFGQQLFEQLVSSRVRNFGSVSLIQAFELEINIVSSLFVISLIGFPPFSFVISFKFWQVVCVFDSLPAFLLPFLSKPSSYCPLYHACEVFILLCEHIPDILRVQVLDKFELTLFCFDSALDCCFVLKHLFLFRFELGEFLFALQHGLASNCDFVFDG